MTAQSQWFVRRGEQTLGPFSWERLKELAIAGRLRRDDEVRRGDRSAWSPAAAIDGLFPPSPAAARAAPPRRQAPPPKPQRLESSNRPPIMAPAESGSRPAVGSASVSRRRPNPKAGAMGNVATWGYFCIVAGLLLMRVSRWFHGDAFISGVGYLITGLAIVVALAGVGCGIAGLITQLEKPVYSIVAIFACGLITLLMVSSLFIFTGEGETIANENAEAESAAVIPDDIHFFTLERIARSGRADLMEKLLSEDAMIHSLNFEGDVVPISVAFARHPNDAGKVLLDAAEYDHWEIVQMLVDFGRRHNLPGLSPARAYSKAETIAEVDELLEVALVV